MIQNQVKNETQSLSLKQSSLKQLGFFGRLLKTKNPDELVEQASKHGLKRTLGVFDLTVLGIGAIIGAGIFTLSGAAAVGSPEHLGAGPALMLSFIIAGIACALAAVCYAEFASMIPVAGSAYTYTFATLGELSAWLIGWVLLLEYAIGNITVACGWTGYLFQFLEGFKAYLPTWAYTESYWVHTYSIMGHPVMINIPAIAIIGFVVSTLYKGVQESTKMATFMVMLKTAVIALFVFAGAFYVKPTNWVPFAPNGMEGVFSGAFMVFFAYIGFDAVSTAAEEAKNPTRDIPIGIMTSLTGCTAIYIAVAAVLTGIIPWNQINPHAAVAAALRIIHLDWAAGFVALGAVAGLTSVLLVMQLATTRILYAMSRDKLLPGVISQLHPKFKTPHINTIISGLIVIAGTFFLDLDAAAQLCSIGTLAVFAVVCVGVIILKVTEPDRVRPFTVPSVPSAISIGIMTGTIGAGIGNSFGNALYGGIIGATAGAIVGLVGDIKQYKPFVFFQKIAIPVYGVLICGALAKLGVPAKTFVQFSVFMAVGLGIYFLYGFRKTNEQIQTTDIQVMQAVTQEEKVLQEV